MSDWNDEQQRALECLRLASDLMQLSKETLNPELKAHCEQMAAACIDHAVSGPVDERIPPDALLH